MTRARITAAIGGADRRVRDAWWPILQQGLAATIAWLIADLVGPHPIPFFAPIAAVVALNTRLGGRGLQALRLLVGVTVGILVGAQAVRLIDHTAVALSVAVFVAMLGAAAVGGAPVTLAQSAASAVLTVTVPYGGAGGMLRLTDALIGVAVALVFSQVLFSPRPLRLIRRAETAALQKMALGLDQAASAMRGEPDAAEHTLRTLRGIHGELEHLGFSQTAGVNVSRRSVRGWRQRRRAVTESEEAAQLQYLGPDCLIAARAGLAVTAAHREPLAAALAAIADVLRLLADDPGSAQVRSLAADRLNRTAARLTEATDRAGDDDAVRNAVAAIDLLVTDTLVFCGVKPEPGPG